MQRTERHKPQVNLPCKTATNTVSGSKTGRSAVQYVPFLMAKRHVLQAIFAEKMLFSGIFSPISRRRLLHNAIRTILMALSYSRLQLHIHFGDIWLQAANIAKTRIWKGFPGRHLTLFAIINTPSQAPKPFQCLPLHLIAIQRLYHFTSPPSNLPNAYLSIQALKAGAFSRLTTTLPSGHPTR